MTQNVAKTIGFTAFAKINHLWLQRQGPPINAAAATDFFFRKNGKTNGFSNIFLVEITFSLTNQWEINILTPEAAPECSWLLLADGGANI